MRNYKTKWHTQDSLSEDHIGMPCRQVYVWLITSDGKVAVVSKNGVGWQMPGGKPVTGETSIQTAVREVHEETGMDIALYADQLHFFGYYVVKELEDDEETSIYTQLRYVLSLPDRADGYSLHANAEDTEQSHSDIIRFVEFVSLDELKQRISWITTSEEYLALKDKLYPGILNI